jgi:trans-aconitate methyltransferase
VSERARTFDALHAADPDPWGATASAYEREKFSATLAALPPHGYTHALDAGCSNGVLTRRLADRCARVTAVDVSAVALAEAARRCAGLPVSLVRAELPELWPQGPFDLVLLSEILYFMAPEEVRLTARRTADTLAPGGTIALVNWRGPCDLALGGDAAADLFIAALGGSFEPLSLRQERLYRIDVLAGR